MLGSFLNVCIFRLPAGESVVTPPSHCRACGHRVRAIDNVPVLSWLALRGKCRDCGAKVSPQYPLVEACLALLFVACVLHSGATWQTLLDAALCFLLLGLAVMDARTMLLPNAFTLGGLALGFVLQVFTPGAADRFRIAWTTLASAGIAAGLLLAVWAAYRLIRHRDGIGMGDVKLLAMIATFLGLPLVLVNLFLAVIAAAIFALVLVALRKATRFDRLPFGSFLAAAGVFTIFAGGPLLHWYLGLF